MSAAVPYLISKFLDPVFALGIGIAAAGVRINREEKEKGKTTQESIESLRRRWRIMLEKDEGSAEVNTGKGGS